MTSRNEAPPAALTREHREIDEGIGRFAADPSSIEAAASLAAAIAALRRHIYLEEEFVFPALSADGLLAPIFVMLREHARIWQALDALESDVAVSDGAPDVSLACHQLLVQLQHHNMKEERIVYPEAERTLPNQAAQRLDQYLRSGTLPDGWVCFKARS